MKTLTYLIAIVTIGVLARAFFSWNNADDQRVSADTTEVVFSETNKPKIPDHTPRAFPRPPTRSGDSQQSRNDRQDNNDQDSSTSANASAQNDRSVAVSDDTKPPLIINEISTQQTNNSSLITHNSQLPATINHNVPFFPQAPDGNRSLPWAEACEEASIALANYFIKNKPLTRDQFRADLLAMVDRQMELFKDYIHTSIAQTKQLYLDFYGGAAYILDNPSIRDMKAILAQWHVIVAPFAGRKLGNPHYSGQWPWYHMLIIRGYDDNYFYTNDVWTRRGENFKYTHTVIMEALHDLNYDDINAWAKRILVITE